MIYVVNFRNANSLPSPCVYVGRAMPGRVEGSPLGNPFKLTKGQTRDAVISQYRTWLWQQINDPHSKARQELRRLAALARERDLYLACWCAPESCHADVVKSAIEWINQTNSD